LLSMIGQFVAVLIALIPAAVLFGLTFYILRLFFGLGLAIPVASLAATSMLALEGILGLWMLGWLFERLDLSSEQTF